MCRGEFEGSLEARCAGATPALVLRVAASPLILAWAGLLACVSGPQSADNTDYGFDDAPAKTVWARGPWDAIKPSRDIDEVIDQLCPAVMSLPRARGGDYGQEYCGVIYQLLSEKQYYASSPSPLTNPTLSAVGKIKTCLVPARVKDARGMLQREGDYHGHPWPTAMSARDRMRENQWYMFRIQFDTQCRVQKLIPHLAGDNLPGELYERHGKGWKLVGYILPEDKDSGRVTAITQ